VGPAPSKDKPAPTARAKANSGTAACTSRLSGETSPTASTRLALLFVNDAFLRDAYDSGLTPAEIPKVRRRLSLAE
jgi:hypothetical protein